jgi:amidophosphoribosyltransferase
MIILPSSFASKSKPKPGRADSVERWDAHKKPRSPASSCGSSSPERGSSCERWDIAKKKIPSTCSTSTSSSSSSRGSSSSSTSCKRWDTHKKARSAQSWTGEQEEQDIGEKQPGMDPAVFSGSSFFASPEPSMLPVPAFFRSRGHGMMSSVPAY